MESIKHRHIAIQVTTQIYVNTSNVVPIAVGEFVLKSTKNNKVKNKVNFEVNFLKKHEKKHP